MCGNVELAEEWGRDRTQFQCDQEEYLSTEVRLSEVPGGAVAFEAGERVATKPKN